MPAVLVPKQKVQQIPAFAAGLAVQLGVAAVAAADGDELFVLDVKYFGEVPPVACSRSDSYCWQPHLGQMYWCFSIIDSSVL